MNVKINCPECQTLIEVAETNKGKPIRCPVCNHISTPKLSGSNVGKIEGDAVFDDSHQSQIESPAPRRLILGLDKEILISFCLGVASIVCNFLCCGPFVGFPAAIVGFVYVLMSQSQFRQSGFMLNGIGLVISSCFLLFRYLW